MSWRSLSTTLVSVSMLSALRLVPRSDRSAMTGKLPTCCPHPNVRGDSLRITTLSGSMFRIRQISAKSQSTADGGSRSYDRRHLIAGGNDAFTHPDPGQDESTDDEEHDQGDDGPAVGVGELVHQPEDQRPEPARAAFHGLVQAEALCFASAGDELAVHRAR